MKKKPSPSVCKSKPCCQTDRYWHATDLPHYPFRMNTRVVISSWRINSESGFQPLPRPGAPINWNRHKKYSIYKIKIITKMYKYNKTVQSMISKNICILTRINAYGCAWNVNWVYYIYIICFPVSLALIGKRWSPADWTKPSRNTRME